MAHQSGHMLGIKSARPGLYVTYLADSLLGCHFDEMRWVKGYMKPRVEMPRDKICKLEILDYGFVVVRIAINDCSSG